MRISLNKIIIRIVRRLAGFIFARYFFAKIVIALIAGTVVLFLFLSDTFGKFELVTLDQRFRLRPQKPVDDDIVLVEMGEDSIDAIGRWPWPREWHATLITVLKKYGANLVIFDVIFDKPSSESQDLVLAQAIQSAGNVYLPFVFQFKKGDSGLLEETPDNIRGVIAPLGDFSSNAKGEGHVNVAPDMDGKLRRVPLIIDFDGKSHQQIAFKVACDYLGVKDKDIIIESGRRVVLRNIPSGDIRIPIDSHDQMLVNWAGPWRSTFRHLSYIDIISSYKQALAGERPVIDLAQLKGKICIVGLTASGLYDIRPTPLEAAYPVVGMNANVINNILKNDFISAVSSGINIMLIYLMGILIAVVVSKARFLRGAVYTSALIAGYIVVSFLVFAFFGKWVAIVYPAASMFISFLGVTLYHEAVLALERRKYFDLSIRDGLTKLFNIRHFKEILDREFKVCVGRKTKRLSLIMTDVDHFKNFNDTYGHQVGDFVLKRVARMFKDGSRAQDVVARYGGEEFIMMLPGTDVEDARKIAERIRERIEQAPLKRSNETYSVTVSLGVATLEDEKTKEELIKKVDDALYVAKRTGRNRVCVAGVASA